LVSIVIAAVSFVVGMVYIKNKEKQLTNKKHNYEMSITVIGSQTPMMIYANYI
jgi:uncharacterized protein YoxC